MTVQPSAVIKAMNLVVVSNLIYVLSFIFSKFSSFKMELNCLFFVFQAISVALPKNLRAEIYSVYPPFNAATATTTAVMKATKGIVVSEVLCESSITPFRSAQNPQSLYVLPTDQPYNFAINVRSRFLH